MRHVGSRAEATLLRACPQGEPHRAAHLETRRLEDAHRFEHYHASGRVVCGACRSMPRIKVRPDHDDLRGEVRAGDLRNDVERVGLRRMVVIGDAHLERHWNLPLQRPRDAFVVLGGDDDLGCHGIRPGIEALSGERGVIPQSTVPDHHRAARAARLQQRDDTLVDEELHALSRELEIGPRGTIWEHRTGGIGLRQGPKLAA